MADKGVRGTADGSADSDLCTEAVGMRRDWAEGTYTVTCEACGTSLREVTDTVTGESVLLHRKRDRWVEWTGASSLTVVVDGRVPHPRGPWVTRGGRVYEREGVRVKPKRVRK